MSDTIRIGDECHLGPVVKRLVAGDLGFQSLENCLKMSFSTIVRINTPSLSELAAALGKDAWVFPELIDEIDDLVGNCVNGVCILARVQRSYQCSRLASNLLDLVMIAQYCNQAARKIDRPFVLCFAVDG
jgi:hypothetical protein